MNHFGTIEIYTDPEDNDKVVLQLSSDRLVNLDGHEGRGFTLTEALDDLSENILYYEESN